MCGPVPWLPWFLLFYFLSSRVTPIKSTNRSIDGSKNHLCPLTNLLPSYSYLLTVKNSRLYWPWGLTNHVHQFILCRYRYCLPLIKFHLTINYYKLSWPRSLTVFVALSEEDSSSSSPPLPVNLIRGSPVQSRPQWTNSTQLNSAGRSINDRLESQGNSGNRWWWLQTFRGHFFWPAPVNKTQPVVSSYDSYFMWSP